jgi:hypothetical protein
MKKKNCRFTAMRKHLFLIVTSLFAGLIFESCSKSGTVTDDGGGGSHVVTPNDTTPPEVVIFTPAASQIFSSGSTINITGRITDDLGLYRGTIKVVNDATGTVLMNQAYEIHGQKLYNFNINYTTSVTTASDYTVTVSFEDHGSNTTAKSVVVKVNP